MNLYKTFPPRWSHIRVPLSSRAAAKAAISLYAPCTRRGYAVQRAAWLLVTTAGPRALPGAAAPWEPAVEPDAWQQLLVSWDGLVGAHDTTAVYQRPQQGRAGFALLLLRKGEPLAFIRVRRGDGDPFRKEHDVLHALVSAGPLPFWHPRPIGITSSGSWHSLITSPLPPAMHRPVARLDLSTMTAAISSALAPVLPRSDRHPGHWVPMHGDFTPWNVRRIPGAVAVVDWEDADWGPPGADAALYVAAQTALGYQPHDAGNAEAADFWLRRLTSRREDQIDAAFNRALVAALRNLTTRR